MFIYKFRLLLKEKIITDLDAEFHSIQSLFHFRVNHDLSSYLIMFNNLWHA